ncbi:20848_t:CDS:2, partial [Gigaspora rosea]
NNRSSSFFFAIFTTFCPPLILQSDNKKEFVYSVIVELVQLWSTFKSLIADQGTLGKIERANGILEEKLGKDEIPDEFRLESIQEPINDLDNLINNNNTDTEPLMKSSLQVRTASLINQDS